jgi:murein DD-endopeptidase MepM/ murein hydrolase activator NlpD
MRHRGLKLATPAFVAGLLVGGMLTWSYLNAPARQRTRHADDGGAPIVDARPRETPAAVSDKTAKAVHLERLGPDAVADLRSRALTLPVKGIELRDLHSSFDEQRGEGRRHEAMDILAPRNTPVIAVEDGTVARLFTSKAGGLTVYQFDPTSTYAYYYAHLERYADGLIDHARVKRGQVLGYVGTSGNAPKDTPHLHFAIFKLTDAKRWWEGTAIDPYSVLR